MITVNNLTYRYRHETQDVLHEINFSVKTGEIVALVGQNGSGKSTLGKLLAGILKPRKHQVMIDGLDLAQSKNSQAVFQKVGIVFQNPENQIIFSNVFDEMNFSVRNLEDVNARINYALQTVNMQECPHANLAQFSLGQKQRIVLAEMLARQPQYLILDEPTTMLDSAGKIAIHQVIRQLRAQNLGILLITNLAEELLLADRILILSSGDIVAQISSQELLSKVEILEKYHIALPQILQLVKHLRNAGLNILPTTWNPESLAQEIIHACV